MDLRGNATFYLPFGKTEDTYLSFDYFGTRFGEQMIVDYDNGVNAIDFYALNGRRSYTNSYQADFNVVPFRGLLLPRHSATRMPRRSLRDAAFRSAR